MMFCVYKFCGLYTARQHKYRIIPSQELIAIGKRSTHVSILCTGNPMVAVCMS